MTNVLKACIYSSVLMTNVLITCIYSSAYDDKRSQNPSGTNIILKKAGRLFGGLKDR